MTTGVANTLFRGTHGPGYGNVHESERTTSMVLGGGLLLLGARGHGLKRSVLAGTGLALLWRGISGHSHLYRLLDLNTARPENVDRAGSDQVSSVPHGQGVRLDQTVVINRSTHEVYEFWRRLENLPRFMKRLKSVERIGVNRSRWTVRGPLGRRITWDAELVTDEPHRRISWRSLPDSEMANAGTVRFMPATLPERTVVKVSLKYNPPAGRLGATLTALVGEEPQQELCGDLWRLKRILESRPVRLPRLGPPFSAPEVR